MKTRCHHKKIKGNSCHKPNDQQSHPGNTKRKPEDKKIVQVRNYELVQKGYLIQQVNLQQNERREPDNISQQITHLSLFFCFIYFFLCVFQKLFLLFVLKVLDDEHLLQVRKISCSFYF